MNAKFALCLVVVACMMIPAEAGWRRSFRSIGKWVRKVKNTICRSPARYVSKVNLACLVTGDVDFDSIEGLSEWEKEEYDEQMQQLADEFFDEMSQSQMEQS